GLPPSRPQRPLRQPALPGHHELRSGDLGGGLPRHHGPRPRARHQLLRHRQRLRLGQGRRSHRADRRAVVRPGRRAAREDGDRHEAVRLDERLAQRHVPVGPQHQARVRRLVAAAADRPHRPLPDAPRRPPYAVGRDLGGLRGAARPGQGALLRSLQPRRLAPRQGHGGGPETAPVRPGERAVDLQPPEAGGRARGAARLPGLRPRCDSVVAAQRRPARRHHPQDGEGAAAAHRSGEGRAQGAPQVHQGLRGPVRRARRAACRRGAGLAAAPGGGHRADHRPADAGAARRGSARDRGRPDRGGARPAGRALPWPGGSCPRGLRLV
ncbi:MAG: Uncharacterized oxidoreductase YrpG, partial [uncultured Nocardioidaceae bacterium]